jgi:hypothetical protein
MCQGASKLLAVICMKCGYTTKCDRPPSHCPKCHARFACFTELSEPINNNPHDPAGSPSSKSGDVLRR